MVIMQMSLFKNNGIMLNAPAPPGRMPHTRRMGAQDSDQYSHGSRTILIKNTLKDKMLLNNSYIVLVHK